MGYQNIFSSEGGRVLTLSFFSGHPGMGWVFFQIFFSGYLLIDRLKDYYWVSKYLLIRRGEGAHFELLLQVTKGFKSKDGKLETSLGFFYRIFQTAVPAPSSTSTASLCFLICSSFPNFAVLFTNVYFTFFLGHFIFLF